MIDTIDSIQCVIDVVIKEKGLFGLFSVPEFGKTTLMMYVVHKLSETGKKGLVFSLQYSKEPWLSKMNLLKMNSDNVVIVDDYPISISEMEEIIRKEKPELVFIDYLQLIDKDSAQTLIELARLSDSLSIGILISGSLYRTTGDWDADEMRPELFDLMRTIDQSTKTGEENSFRHILDAILSMDLIIFLHRPHECWRWVGTARRYNVSDKAELINKYLFNTYPLPKTCHFDFGVFTKCFDQ